MTPVPVSQPALSELLRRGSRHEHEKAEGSRFMSELLAGRMSTAGYTAYLAMLHQVYATLEEVGRAIATTPAGQAVVDPRLERVPALEQDLAYWADAAVPHIASPAITSYVATIRATRHDPVLFIAHHYTRYLGDLSGGQAIARILTRTYGLQNGAGVAFYDFTAVGKPKPYKDGYRERLDALKLDETQAARVLCEVKRAFALNTSMFAELTAKYVRT